jgi:predicted transposase YbfD/YdcC
MKQDLTLTIQECFQEVEDPRASNRWHRLEDIITIAILAAVCGADTWVEVAEYGEGKESWLQQYLSLPHGIPSHDTFGRVFAVLNPEQLQQGFLKWVSAVHTVAGDEVVAVDGKQLRRSHDRTDGKSALHMVSAWAAQSRVVLGQWAVDSKSNEITAIPHLLDQLALQDCIVTVDALNCQRTIAAKIVGQGADYVMAVKKNQNELYRTLDLLFRATPELDWVESDYHQEFSNGHGRVEHRECWVTDDADYLEYIAEHADWPGLQSLIRIKTVRQTADERTVSQRYFISTLPADATLALQSVRKHWHIENRLHWVLDIGFREDESRVRKGSGAANFAVIRHIALNLLEHEESAACGTHAKRLKAGWDNDYLLKVLNV